MVEIKVRKVGRATVVEVKGRLELGQPEQTFRHTIQKLREAGAARVAVDLSGVDYIDSAGVGALVRIFNSFQQSGGRCRFFAPSKRVLQLLRMVRLDTVLELAEDERSALEAL